MILGEVDAGGDQETGKEAQLGNGLAEPEIGEGKGKDGLEVGEDRGLAGGDEGLAFGIGPESDDGPGDGHVEDAKKSDRVTGVGLDDRKG